MIAFDGVTMVVTDGTAPPAAKKIAFQDMLGQPTWLAFNLIQVKLVMRGDLNLGDQVTLPPSLATTTQQALLRYRDKTTFSGNYQIQAIHHYGNFRQADAMSWNTTVDLFPVPK